MPYRNENLQHARKFPPFYDEGEEIIRNEMTESGQTLLFFVSNCKISSDSQFALRGVVQYPKICDRGVASETPQTVLQMVEVKSSRQ